jgi:hypothetical protein
MPDWRQQWATGFTLRSVSVPTITMALDVRDRLPVNAAALEKLIEQKRDELDGPKACSFGLGRVVKQN